MSQVEVGIDIIDIVLGNADIAERDRRRRVIEYLHQQGYVRALPVRMITEGFADM